MNQQVPLASLGYEITALRLQEIETKKKIADSLRELQKNNEWKALGYKSMKEFCAKELEYDFFEIRELLVATGVVLTRAQMIDDDPNVQARIDALREWRKKTASAQALSAFLILSNRTLMAIAKETPTTPGQLAQIPGIGPRKIQSYGDEILLILGSTYTS